MRNHRILIWSKDSKSLWDIVCHWSKKNTQCVIGILNSRLVFAYGPKTGEAFLRFFAFKFRVLRNGLLRYIFHTCPKPGHQNDNVANITAQTLRKWCDDKSTHVARPAIESCKKSVFSTTRASFCVCTPLKFRYRFCRSVQAKIHCSLW